MHLRRSRYAADLRPGALSQSPGSESARGAPARAGKAGGVFDSLACYASDGGMGPIRRHIADPPKSTSRQRKATSSPCRSPVNAAVR